MKVFYLILFVFIIDLRLNSVQAGTAELEGHNPCSGLLVGTVRHPESCRKYFICFYGIRQEKKCKKNFGFSEELKICVPMRGCRKINEETTSQPEPETTTEGVEITMVLGDQETVSHLESFDA
ncbi:hypothetical protein ACFFRR_000704 [Megaselia abdita]